MPGPLPAVLPLLDAGVAAAGLGDLVEAMASAGARWVEYRDKEADDRTALARAARLQDRCRALGLTLLVNDRVDVALAVGAGVHLGQQDLPADVARRLLGEAAVIGLSVDTVGEALTAARLPVDYLALGPVFATVTKGDAGPVVGLEGLAAVRDAVETPLVAIGGITPDNAAAVTAAGADCVAAVSSIVGSPDPAAAMAALRAAAEDGLARRRTAGGR